MQTYVDIRKLVPPSFYGVSVMTEGLPSVMTEDLPSVKTGGLPLVKSEGLPSVQEETVVRKIAAKQESYFV